MIIPVALVEVGAVAGQVGGEPDPPVASSASRIIASRKPPGRRADHGRSVPIVTTLSASGRGPSRRVLGSSQSDAAQAHLTPYQRSRR